MIPLLHTQKYSGGNDSLIGRLADCIRCEVREHLNGEYELELEYPLTGAHAEDLITGRVIVAKPSYQASWLVYIHNQPFRIYDVTDEDGIRYVYAHHISYDLNMAMIYQFSATGVHNVLQHIEDNIVRRSSDTLPWEFTSDLTYVPTVYTVDHPMSVREVLGGTEGSILDTFGGEFEWDEFTVKLLKKRSYSEFVVRYGVNLMSFEREENYDSSFTHVMVYYFNADLNQLVVSSAMAVSDLSQYASQINQSRTRLIDVTDQFEETPVKADLDTLAQSYAADMSAAPAVGINVEVANLQAAGEETPLTKGVNLGDTVTIHYTPLNITTTQKVVETTWDVIQNRYTSVIVGTPQATLADTIADMGATSASGGGGTGNYEQLNNLPSINGTTIIGALSLADIGAASAAALNNKVDKVDGKGLSTNDFTDAYKTKLDGIATDAEVNVQADWNVTDSSSDAYIKNKPSWTIDSALSTTSENPVQNKVITNSLNTKLEGVSVNGTAVTPVNHVVDLAVVDQVLVNSINAVDDGKVGISFNGATVTGGAGNVVVTIDQQPHQTWTNAMLGQGYGTTLTPSATAEKAVALSNYQLSVGGIVSVKFEYAVNASATMNINAQGAKPIYFNGSAITANVIKAGDLATFIYDGSYYHLIAIKGATHADVTVMGDPGYRYTAVTQGGTAYYPISRVKVNGTTQTNTNGTVDLAVPDMSYVALGDVAAMQITEGNLTLNAPVLDSTTGLMSPAYLPTASSSVKGVVNVDTALSSSSANPVQNSAVYTALGEKITAPASAVSGNVLTYNGTEWVAGSGGGGGGTGIQTVKVNGTALVPDANMAVDVSVPITAASLSGAGAADLFALTLSNGIQRYFPSIGDTSSGTINPNRLPSATSSQKGAVIVDSALSSSSTNPVQNSVINTALDGKVPTSRTVNGHALTANVTITASDLGLGNVENKSSATIRSEITDSDLTGHANAIAKAETRYVGQATFNSAITTVTTNTLIRKGNVVQCELRWTTPSTQTSSQPVCTIPSGFRPTTRMYASALKTAWTITNGTCPVVFQTSGAVTHINSAFTTSTSYVVCMTWLTDNDYPS